MSYASSVPLDTWYLSSLDSTYLKESHPAFKVRMHHAEWEVALSVMLGGELRLSENQLIDSGAMEILSRALRARSDVFKGRAKRGLARHPFVLGVRTGGLGHTSLTEAVASTFREWNPRREEPRPFELSYWAEITDEKLLRTELASAVEGGPGPLRRFASTKLPDFESKIEALQDLLTYDAQARSGARRFDPERALVPMDKRVSWLLDLDDGDIERIAGGGPDSAAEGERETRDLRDLLRHMKPDADDLGNRTAWYESLASLPGAQ